VCVCEENMVGGGTWRCRVWSKGGWLCFGSSCRKEVRCYPERANNFGASDLA
jgi:hypothetical protein